MKDTSPSKCAPPWNLNLYMFGMLYENLTFSYKLIYMLFSWSRRRINIQHLLLSYEGSNV